MVKEYQSDLIDSLNPLPRIMGLGEVVHGSRTLHEEMLGTAKFLISHFKNTETQIRWLGFEIPSSTGEALNQACHSANPEDVASAVPKLYRIFHSPEYENFFEFIREENWRRKQANETGIEIYGFDIRDTYIQKDAILKYLDESHIRLSDTADRTLRALDKTEFYRAEMTFYNGGAGEDDRRNYNELINQLARLSGLPARLQQSYNLLLDGLSCFVKSDGQYFDANLRRDASMAENVIQNGRKISGNALLFGHYYHVGEVVEDRQIPGVSYRNPKGMGEILKETFGSDYAAIAFTFCEGEYSRTEADIVGVKPNQASMEAVAQSLTTKTLPAYIPALNIPPDLELGHFDIVSGTDEDDSRDPKRGPVSDIFQGVVVCPTSSAVTITRSEH